MTMLLSVIATVVLAVIVATARTRVWLKIAVVAVVAALGMVVVKAPWWLGRPATVQSAYPGQSEPYPAPEIQGPIGRDSSPPFDPGAPAPADDNRPSPAASVKVAEVIQSDACSSFAAQLHLPSDTRVMAVAAAGGRKTGFQIDATAEATQIEVAVNSPAHPLVLMVSGWGPTIWNIGLTTNTRVLAVLASGKGRQAIAGLDRKLPVLSSSKEDDLGCGFFLIERANVQAATPVALHVLHRPVDQVYLATGGSVVVGDPLPYGAALARSPGTAPETFRDRTVPLAGAAGLEESVRKGQLRVATDADWQYWANLAGLDLQRPAPNSPLGGRSIEFLREHAFVVTGPFTFPAGLTGANAVTFLLPAGVPMPKGDGGHSTILASDNRECAMPTYSVICPSSKPH